MKNIFIKDLNIPKDWEDMFYGNDAMYGFEIGDLRIWIDHPIAAESEMYRKEHGEYMRFIVVCSDKYIDENPNDLNADNVLFTSNDFNEVINYVKENK